LKAVQKYIKSNSHLSIVQQDTKHSRIRWWLVANNDGSRHVPSVTFQ